MSNTCGQCGAVLNRTNPFIGFSARGTLTSAVRNMGIPWTEATLAVWGNMVATDAAVCIAAWKRYRVLYEVRDNALRYVRQFLSGFSGPGDLMQRFCPPAWRPALNSHEDVYGKVYARVVFAFLDYYVQVTTL